MTCKRSLNTTILKTTRRSEERIQCTLHKTTLPEPRSRKATCIKTKRKRVNLDIFLDTASGLQSEASRNSSPKEDKMRHYIRQHYGKTKTTTRTNERNTANAKPKCKHKSQGQATSSACTLFYLSTLAQSESKQGSKLSYPSKTLLVQ